MKKYLLGRIVRGVISITIVVLVVMTLLYQLVDRNDIFMADSLYTKKQLNEREVYKFSRWEEYGYLDYVPYGDYLKELSKSGEIEPETQAIAAQIGYSAEEDSETAAKYINQFTDHYKSLGYNVVRLDAMISGGKPRTGGTPQLYAYKDTPILGRLYAFFDNIFYLDNIHSVDEDQPLDGERGISFTLFDPVYGGKTFSPAIIGNGTDHKYLLYFDNKFPFVHQNLFTLRLGKSYSVNRGIDVFATMFQSQGAAVKRTLVYPAGYEATDVGYDLHSATYAPDTFSSGQSYYTTRFTDNYTNLETVKTGLSKSGFSFIIGICATIIAYLIGVPLGILMARKKDTIVDNLGTLYVIFIIAVPSLAYIFMFRAIGEMFRLPTSFNVDEASIAMYILPVVSLALPAIGGLMKWIRRYMIDQMNSDYVKFARSGGLTEKEIFSKHILKNAIIPIVHGIPAEVLFAMTGAIITESVYRVPGAGGMLVNAIQVYDNAAVIGLTFFYASLSVIALILGDVLMSLVDPRISFTEKAR